MTTTFKVVLTLALFALAAVVSPVCALDDNAALGPAPAQNADTPTGPIPSGTAAVIPQDNVTFQTFYDALSNQGTWIQTAQYGYVWQPTVTDPNWAPYTLGTWAYSEDGWTWVSDEPFGWAVYHYGRWANIDGTGWVWVPGYTWAPAWVSWRTSDDYVGWAPLPPESLVGIDYSNTTNTPVPAEDTGSDAGYFIGSDADEYYGIGTGYYIFLPINCLWCHHYHDFYCHRNDNWNLIAHTHNVTNLKVDRRVAGEGGHGTFHRVTAGGPNLEKVNAVSSTPIQKVALTHSTQPGGGTLSGNSLALFAPHINAGTATARPTNVAQSLGQVKVNRGVNISQPLAVNAHIAPPAPTPAQVQQSEFVQNQMPTEAKVASNNNGVVIRGAMQTPVTMMKPIVTQTNQSHVFSPGNATSQQGGTQVFSQQNRTFQQQGGQGTPQQHVFYPAPVFNSQPGAPSSQQQPVTRVPGTVTINPAVPHPSIPVNSEPVSRGGGESHVVTSSGGNSSQQSSGGNSNNGGTSSGGSSSGSSSSSGGTSSGGGGYSGGGFGHH